MEPKFLETANGTSICTLRIAVKRAGMQGHAGISTSSASTPRPTPARSTSRAGARSPSTAGRVSTSSRPRTANYASRISIVAERVEFLSNRNRSTDQASDEASPDQPATDGALREAHAAA